METLDFIKESLETARNTTLKLVSELEEHYLHWQVKNNANTIGFLLFHTFRTEDFRFAQIGEEPEFWKMGNWANRWTLPEQIEADRNTGFGWGESQMNKFNSPSLEDLLGYGATVRFRSLEVLNSMSTEKLNENIEGETDNVSALLFRLLAHESQHAGQIDYILGLIGEQNNQ
jgi:uncharacterized damage-inducible protein DinB